MKRVHIFIEGRVQGVFFRTWTKDQADELGLAGFVRNLGDGRVEIVGEGKKESLDKFVGLCKQGPKLSRVEHIDLVYEEATGEFASFEIKY